MAKKVNFDKKSLDEIKLSVVNLIEGAVKTTLGPAGKVVMLDQGYSTKMTKDGVSIAKAIDLKDPEENSVASFFKTAAVHTVDNAGDGTTTSIVLAANIFKSALKGVTYGANSVLVKSGIDDAIKIAVDAMNELKVVVADDFEKIKQVAIVSANGDSHIGELISDAFQKIGKDGVITVEEGKTKEHDLKVVEGMQFDRGYISSYFVTNTEKMVVELDNPFVLIYDKKISSMQMLLPVLQAVNSAGRGLLIVAEDLDGEALQSLILNKLKGVLKVAAVKAPGFGDRRKEICQDLAALTGGQYISEEAGYRLDQVTINELGQAKRVVMNDKETTIVEGLGEKADIEDRINQIRYQMENATSDYDKEKFAERLAKLAGGVAVINVGGATEEAAKECKDRVDDAVQAVKAAISEGIVPGGSVSLLYARNVLKGHLDSVSGDRKIGFYAVYQALKAPLLTILENAGRDDFALVLDKINSSQAAKNLNFGLDVRNDVFGDLVQIGVIDPLKVVRCALMNAGSVAGMLLTCEAFVTNLSEKDSDHSMGGGMPPMM
ncbi:chaperonin GroEL [Alphaproteobacteria bacterium endosymbiont of Tiliacea citrago]|uniref:chaperonin GroEL n=1 Tax=Alphaproteobacteria bacterium endosymbiont of Tiliacea citrago TaxID=3077944 RepID=UPI00313E821B